MMIITDYADDDQDADDTLTNSMPKADSRGEVFGGGGSESLPISHGVWESAVSLPSGVRAWRSPDRKCIGTILDAPKTHRPKTRIVTARNVT